MIEKGLETLVKEVIKEGGIFARIFGKGILRGSIVDKNKEPIAGVKILLGEGRSEITTHQGTFLFEKVKGKYYISLEYKGKKIDNFEVVFVKGGQELERVWQLNLDSFVDQHIQNVTQHSDDVELIVSNSSQINLPQPPPNKPIILPVVPTSPLPDPIPSLGIVDEIWWRKNPKASPAFFQLLDLLQLWLKEKNIALQIKWTAQSYVGFWFNTRCVLAAWPQKTGSAFYLPDPSQKGDKDNPSSYFLEKKSQLEQVNHKLTWAYTYNAGANPLRIVVTPQSFNIPQLTNFILENIQTYLVNPTVVEYGEIEIEKDSVPPIPTEASTKKSEQDHFVGVKSIVQESYNKIKSTCLTIDPSVCFNSQKYYISIKLSKNIGYLEIRKNRIRLIAMLPEEQIKNVIQSYPVVSLSDSVQKFYNGDCAAVIINHLDAIHEIEQLMKNLVRFHKKGQQEEKSLPSKMEQLAYEYETIREQQPSGSQRTNQLEEFLYKIKTLISQTKPKDFDLDAYLDSSQDGFRIVGLVMLDEFPDPSYGSQVIDMIDLPSSAFEQYHALQVIQKMRSELSFEQQQQLRAVLIHQMDVREGRIKEDGDRRRLATELLNHLPADEEKKTSLSIKLQGTLLKGQTVAEFYQNVLQFLVEQNKIVEYLLPIRSGPKRYILSQEPIHPTGRPFFAPVEYQGFYMEAHASHKMALENLQKVFTTLRIEEQIRPS